ECCGDKRSASARFRGRRRSTRHRETPVSVCRWAEPTIATHPTSCEHVLRLEQSGSWFENSDGAIAPAALVEHAERLRERPGGARGMLEDDPRTLCEKPQFGELSELGHGSLRICPGRVGKHQLERC